MRRLAFGLSIFMLLMAALPSLCAGAKGVSAPKRATTPDRLEGLSGLKNVGRIDEGLYRGAQPDDPQGYETLREMGVKTVLNLRSRHSERKRVEAHGMKSIEIPMGMLDTPDVEEVERAVKAMADPELRPLYVHCALGEDRTGTVVAVYRMKEQGWSLDEAQAEMQAFGFNDIWVNLKRFLKRYSSDMKK